MVAERSAWSSAFQFWFDSEAERRGNRKYCLRIRYQR
jgi:hypothetical protein